jgi:hypothetical protein
MPNRQLRLWGAVVALILLFFLGCCCAYVRLGTTVIGDFVSPDGKWDALLMVRNGGAMTGYATVLTIVSTGNPLARQISLIRAAHVFAVDDNDGAVPWGDHGQIRVKISWVSGTQLVVTYPEKARVFKQEPHLQSVDIRYVASE